MNDATGPAAATAPEHDTAPTPGDAGEQRQAPASDTGAPSLSIPLSFELATVSLPLSRLQAVQQGAVLEVEATDGSLPVRILANGRLLAHGTLVSVGDGYGVLVEKRAEGG